MESRWGTVWVIFVVKKYLGESMRVSIETRGRSVFIGAGGIELGGVGGTVACEWRRAVVGGR